jgi:Fe2+ or Zn2+ uptake regulation protein
MKNIYVLTEGSYSDYHIVGVYSTKELAEEAQSLYKDSQIEEYDLDNIPEHPPGMSAWFVKISDGKLDDIHASQVSPFDQTVPRENEYKYPNGRTTYTVYCWAVDKEHAEKIALDKYYQHQATKAGIA